MRTFSRPTKMIGAQILLLILNLLHGAVCQGKKVTLPRAVEVMSGSCLTIPCSFELKTDEQQYLHEQCKTAWKSQNENIYSSANSKLSTTRDLTGDLMKNNCTTTFNNMHLNYSNTYFMRLDCKNRVTQTFQEAGVTISVIARPPPPTLSPSVLNVTEGSVVKLTCSAPAPCHSHPPTLIWNLQQADVQEDLKENKDKTKFMVSVVTFTASHLHHGTPLSCSAVYRKQDGTAAVAVQASLTASVSYPPKETSVLVRDSGPLSENSKVNLTCKSTANPAVTRYTWHRLDGNQETAIGNERNLTIDASKVFNPLYCKAENDVGVGRSSKMQLDIQYSPKHTRVSVTPSHSVPENSNVNLTCTAAANPPAGNYKWYTTDGTQETLIWTEQVLNIKASRDRRFFFCEAENHLGFGKSNLTELDVQYSPELIMVEVSPHPVVENSQATVTCMSTANPPVKNYTWYRADEDQQAFIGDGQIIVINATKDRPVFLCKAENEVGVGFSNVTEIDVQFPPQISASSNCSRASSQLNCSCETEGNPAPTLNWYLDDLPVSQSGRITVRNEPASGRGWRSIITVDQPQDADLSTLLCHSANFLGSATQTFCTNSHENFAESEVQLLWLLFIITVVTLLLIICFLLFVIRSHRNQYKLNPQLVTDEINTFPTSQLSTPERNEKLSAVENSYAERSANNSTSELNSSSVPGSGPNDAEMACKRAEINIQLSVIHSSLHRNTKDKRKKTEDSVEISPAESSFLQEEQCMAGDYARSFVKKALELGSTYEVEPRTEGKTGEDENARIKCEDVKK